MLYLHGAFRVSEGGMLLLSGSKLVYPASTNGENSSIQMCLLVDGKTSSVRLETHVKERESGRRGERWVQVFFKKYCHYTLKQSARVLYILLIFFLFPHPSATLSSYSCKSPSFSKEVSFPLKNCCVRCHLVAQIVTHSNRNL